MYVLPSTKRDLREHPPWLAIQAYAGDPTLVGNNLHSRIRSVLSRKARAMVEQPSSTLPSSSTVPPPNEGDLSTANPTLLLPLRFTSSTVELVAHSVVQPSTTSASARDNTYELPTSSSQHGSSTALDDIHSKSGAGAGELGSDDPCVQPALHPSGSDFATAAAPPTATMTVVPHPTGSLPPKSLKRPHSAMAPVDDSTIPPAKQRRTNGSLPITRPQTAQATARPSSSRVMVSHGTARPPPAPQPGPAELREQVSVMKAVLNDLLVEKAWLLQANATYASELQAQAAHVHALQRDASQLPELQAQIQSAERNASLLHLELGNARVRVAGLDASKRRAEEQLAAEREENRRLTARVSALQAQIARVPALEREVQDRTADVQDLHARLDTVNGEQDSTLAKLRRALGDEDGFWDDAPVSMVLVAVENNLKQLTAVNQRASEAENEAAMLRARVSALELGKLSPGLVPALEGALAQIVGMVGVV
ncbi:hypothetical protein PENSPDRAFT_17526 [Peniophora sp. CONT]|nr:hypothetical protein PENSPDRAFT_17526 [Peniophora sp. CONT]